MVDIFGHSVSNVTTGSSNHDCHPVTGKNERYSMYDRFHEKNSNNPDDVLIRLAICPQPYANVNSESHEQLHSVLNKDNYFLIMMQPATHVFMKRPLVHLRNQKLNNEEITPTGTKTWISRTHFY
jgi:hypothetical protein